MDRVDCVKLAASQFRDGKAMNALAALKHDLKDIELVIRVHGILKVTKDYSEAGITAAIKEITG